jgi:hypothetical protein
VFSCHYEEDVKLDPKVTITPLTDERIKAEILSLVEGTQENALVERNVALYQVVMIITTCNK